MWKRRAGLTITLQLKQQHSLSTSAAEISSGIESDEAEVAPVTALVRNFQREVFFEKRLFINPEMFSLKSINADEFPLMQSSAGSASGPGSLETSRFWPQHQDNAC